MRFTHTYSLALFGLPVGRTVIRAILVLSSVFLLLPAGLGWVRGESTTAETIFFVLLGVVPVALLAISEILGPLARELVVDRSGLTIRRKRASTHLRWRDIAQVGVLQQPKHLVSVLYLPQAAAQYIRPNILVVRLRPEIPAPSIVSLLSDEHRRLGYLGLCALEGLGSSREEITNALERFAGGRLVHSPRQFLDRDPRLRPDMV